MKTCQKNLVTGNTSFEMLVQLAQHPRCSISILFHDSLIVRLGWTLTMDQFYRHHAWKENGTSEVEVIVF